MLSHPDDKSKIQLIYCNSTEHDILLDNEITQLEAEHSNRLEVIHCVSRVCFKLILTIAKLTKRNLT